MLGTAILKELTVSVTGGPKRWSDASLLKSIPSPNQNGIEIKHKTDELTFLGVADQPDFAELFMTFYPNGSVIELRSLKKYLQQFRNTIVSYERLTNIIHDDLMSVYKPKRLRLVMILSSRGGISSKMTIDSDWAARGGKEEYKDWVGQPDEW